MTSAALSPLALSDLRAATRWIAKDNHAAARALRRAVAAATQRIGSHPGIGVRRPDLIDDPYRILVLTAFPYVIVYNSARRPPLVLRVLHSARDLAAVLENYRTPSA